MHSERVRDALRALPQLDPPPRAWDAIVAARATARRRSAWLRGGGLALAASVVMAVALLTLRGGDVPGPVPANGADMQMLVERSRNLDVALAAYEDEARVLDLGTADTIAVLEDRLAVVDAMLRRTDTLTPDAARELLRHRIELTQALIDVHASQTLHSF